MQRNGNATIMVLSGFEIDPERPGQRGGMMPQSQKLKVRFEDGETGDVRVKNPPFDLRTLAGQKADIEGMTTSQAGYVSAKAIHRPGTLQAMAPAAAAGGWGVAPSAPAPRTNGGTQQSLQAPRAAVGFGVLVHDYATCLKVAIDIGHASGLAAPDVTAIAATLFIQASKQGIRPVLTRGDVRAACAVFAAEAPPLAAERPPPFEPPEQDAGGDDLRDMPF